MKQNSFFMGCNYSNSERTGWSVCPVQDIDTVFANRCGVNVNGNVDDEFSLMCRRQVKEELKHTMLFHESVFESQVHELHRLYQKQKELTIEMERTRRNAALCLNYGFPSPRTHWMRSYPYGENIPNLIDVGDKKVLDLELPVFEYNGEERGFMNHVPNFLKEQSLESGKQSNKLQLDLNEPAKIEELSDYVFNQFLSPTTPDVIGEKSNKKNEGEDEAEGQPLSAKCEGEYGIDLNVSLFTAEEEEVTIVNKFETEKPQESLSVSLHGEHGSEQPRVLVQALPCSNSILLLDKRCKPWMRGSKAWKKLKLGPSNETFKASDSQCNQASMEKESSSFLSKVIPAKKRTKLGKKRPREQLMKSSHGRTKRKKSTRVSLVDIFAAEALVDVSTKSGRETSESLCGNLLWLAEISSLVAEDYKIDIFEALTLQLSVEEKKMILRLKSADNKTAVSSIACGRQKRSRTKQGKRKYNDEANEDLRVIEKVTEASEPVGAFISSVEGTRGVDWGVVRKGRRGSRIPATDFQQMIIKQVVV